MRDWNRLATKLHLIRQAEEPQEDPEIAPDEWYALSQRHTDVGMPIFTPQSNTCRKDLMCRSD